MTKFGSDFRAARHRKNITVQNLAVMLGVNAVTVYRWETGRSKPHPMCRVVIEKILGVKF